MNKCFSPYPSLLLGGNEGGGGNLNSPVPQFWGANAVLGSPQVEEAARSWGFPKWSDCRHLAWMRGGIPGFMQEVY